MNCGSDAAVLKSSLEAHGGEILQRPVFSIDRVGLSVPPLDRSSAVSVNCGQPHRQTTEPFFVQLFSDNAEVTIEGRWFCSVATWTTFFRCSGGQPGCFPLGLEVVVDRLFLR